MSQPNTAAGHHHDIVVPRWAVVAGAGLMVASLALAAWGRASRLADPPPAPRVLRSVELRFEDRPGGALAVLAGEGRREVSLLPAGSNNFVRGVLRSMFRGRKLESLGRDARFVLSLEEGDQLALGDPETGRRVELNAFGVDNVAAFRALLDQAAAGGTAP